MRSWLARVVVGAVAVASVAAAPLALASTHKHHHVTKRHAVAKRATTDTTASENASETAGENASETAGESGGTESPNDTAQQNAACAGKGDNVQYDPSTGCSADAGGGPNDQTQQ